MDEAYKSRENFNEFSYLVEKILAKKPKKFLGLRPIGNGMKMFTKSKIKKPSSKILRVLAKNH